MGKHFGGIFEVVKNATDFKSIVTAKLDQI